MNTKQLQNLLAYLGYYSGAIDGILGAGTKSALKSFQMAYGITADGIPGANSYKALKQAVASDKFKKETVVSTTQTATGGDFWSGIEYFKRSEFACKCGKYCNGYPVEMDASVVRAADKVRAHFNSPVTVSSGIRCSKHNAAVGGVSNSRHTKGKAIDFSVRSFSASMVLAYVQSLPEIRYAYAINSSYVHMDVL